MYHYSLNFFFLSGQFNGTAFPGSQLFIHRLQLHLPDQLCKSLPGGICICFKGKLIGHDPCDHPLIL